VQAGEQASQVEVPLFQKYKSRHCVQVVTSAVVEHSWQLGKMVVHRLQPVVEGS
jgi:hypothetical protein